MSDTPDLFLEFKGTVTKDMVERLKVLFDHKVSVKNASLIREDLDKMIRDTVLAAPLPWRYAAFVENGIAASGNFNAALFADEPTVELTAEPGSPWEAALKRNGAL